MPTGIPAEPVPQIIPISYSGSLAEPYVDVSIESPAQQFAALVALIEAADAAAPAPFTGTPPWNEGNEADEFLPEGVLEENYIVAPDLQANANATAELHSEISDAATNDIPEWDWENDPQYFGLGVPPGVQNWGQADESGHTQITLPDPSSEHGWDAWSGRVPLARVARHENMFTQYSAGVDRGLGQRAVEKFVMPYVLNTQQYRDLLLAELNRRGIHNAIVDQVSSVPWSANVLAVDPSALVEEPAIGPEGVLP